MLDRKRDSFVIYILFRWLQCATPRVFSCLDVAGDPPEQQVGMMMMMVMSASKIFEPLTVWAHVKTI